MKFFLTLLFAAVIIISCDDNKEELKHKTSCGKGIFVEDQKWFIDLMENCGEGKICTLIVNRGIYLDDTVYFTGLTGPLCDPVFYIALLDCQGDTVKEYTSGDIDEFNEDVTYLDEVAECAGS